MRHQKNKVKFADGTPGVRTLVSVDNIQRLEKILGNRISHGFDFAFKELLDRYETERGKC